jgi:hypothetical protein
MQSFYFFSIRRVVGVADYREPALCGCLPRGKPDWKSPKNRLAHLKEKNHFEVV